MTDSAPGNVGGIRDDPAAAERERIKAAGAVTACCGTAYTRPRERYGRWTCDGCGDECDLIGVIG